MLQNILPETFLYLSSKTHVIFIGVSDKHAKDEIKAWNDMVLRYEMLTKPIDPDQLTRQESNEVYQELMKSISERTKKNKFHVDYVEEVFNFTLRYVLNVMLKTLIL